MAYPKSKKQYQGYFFQIAIWVVLTFMFFPACQPAEKQQHTRDSIKGKLFIIGGGKRGEDLVQKMIVESKVDKSGYIYILPMASEEADSAIIWSSEQFLEAGITQISGFNFRGREDMTESRLDSVSDASLIYISGGDQRRFMEIVKGSPLQSAIFEAYKNGAVIAGTSAGAAVMSEWMITGTELKYPEYNSTFLHLESGNIELDTGMAFLKSVIIDQHFVKRSRYNRLISAIALHPDKLGVGIDESTAILVEGDSAEVVGSSQVIVFDNEGRSVENENGKIGMHNLRLSIYLPGEKFYIGPHAN